MLLFIHTSFAVSVGQYRQIPVQNLAIITTTEGLFYVELAPSVAPNHVSRFKTLAQTGAYNDTYFYRVIDGFVAQGGPGDAAPEKDYPPLSIESTFPLADVPFTLVQENDLFAPFTGFSHGFAIGTNSARSQGWLTHCPGVVAMARGNPADSATTDFYVVIGQAPRYLDSLMTVFGKVVHGMDVVQRLRRAPPSGNGVFKDLTSASQIINVQIASQLPVAQRPTIKIENTHHRSFLEKLKSRKHRTHPFFFKAPPAVLDVCQVPVKSQFLAAPAAANAK